MEKAEVDMIIILNFLEFGRAVVCDEDEVDQSIWVLRACLGWYGVMRRRINSIWIDWASRKAGVIAREWRWPSDARVVSIPVWAP